VTLESILGVLLAGLSLNAVAASLIEWTGALDAVMKTWNFDRLMPGHGRMSNKAGIKAYRDRVEVLRNKAQALARSGKSQAELSKFMEVEYG